MESERDNDILASADALISESLKVEPEGDDRRDEDRRDEDRRDEDRRDEDRRDEDRRDEDRRREKGDDRRDEDRRGDDRRDDRRQGRDDDKRREKGDDDRRDDRRREKEDRREDDRRQGREDDRRRRREHTPRAKKKERRRDDKVVSPTDRFKAMLTTKGMTPVKSYVLNDTLLYVEVFNAIIGDSCLIQVDPKYDFDPIESVCTLSEHSPDVNNEEELDQKVADMYFGGNYSREISVDGGAPVARLHLAKLHSQVKRLKQVFTGQRARAAFYMEQWMAICDQNDMNFYFMTDTGPSRFAFLPVITLSTVFKEQATGVGNIVSGVREQFYSILASNESNHLIRCTDIIGDRGGYIKSIRDLCSQRQDLKIKVKGLRDLYKKVNEALTISSRKVQESNIHDIDKTKRDRAKLNQIHEKTLDQLISSSGKLDTTSLLLDTALYENSTMLHRVVENFDSLKDIM